METSLVLIEGKEGKQQEPRDGAEGALLLDPVQSQYEHLYPTVTMERSQNLVLASLWRSYLNFLPNRVKYYHSIVLVDFI